MLLSFPHVLGRPQNYSILYHHQYFEFVYLRQFDNILSHLEDKAIEVLQ